MDCGGPYMVNAVARRIYSMVVIHGLVNFGVWQSLSWVRLGQGKRDTDPGVGGSPYTVG